ncbi:MAG: hypothetical protein P1U34_01380 [Coxiellaceae bacterium]|nr:hypothetical protein [Coxiellaceae bacterium]
MFKSRKSDTLSTSYFIPTYTRVMISDWSNIARFIIEHARLMKDKVNPDENQQNHVPSETQVNDALNGPFNGFIHECISAFAKIARVRIEHTRKDSDFFISEATENNPSDIPERLLKQTSSAECDNLTKQLNDHVAGLVQQWRDAANHWVTQVQQQLMSQDLPLSEIEITELKDDEPLSDILDRYTELKVAQPKLPKDMDFAVYYKLKATLAVHSVLSRQQKPHTPDDIEKLIKPLKKLFKMITDEQKQILTSQQAEIAEIIAPVDYTLPKK